MEQPLPPAPLSPRQGRNSSLSATLELVVKNNQPMWNVAFLLQERLVDP